MLSGSTFSANLGEARWLSQGCSRSPEWQPIPPERFARPMEQLYDKQGAFRRAHGDLVSNDQEAVLVIVR
jgi:hypothetical protein